MLRITQHRKIFFVVSAILMALSLAAWLRWGLKPGIDFTGGSLVELQFTETRPEPQALLEAARASLGDVGEVVVQPLGETSMVLRMPPLEEDAHQKLLADLQAKFAVDGGAVQETQFQSVGPLIGAELRKKTVYAVVGAILAILAFITYAFRKVSHPVASWKYGMCTIIALLHDVLFPVGVFSALGHFHGVEVGGWIVTALLTVLGFSVHDTIVVFDRIRENLSHGSRASFEDIVNSSMNDTLGRSINTTLTVMLVLVITYFLGGESIRPFILTMILGIGIGTYSSIFVASPLLVTWYLRDRAKR